MQASVKTYDVSAKVKVDPILPVVRYGIPTRSDLLAQDPCTTYIYVYLDTRYSRNKKHREWMLKLHGNYGSDYMDSLCLGKKAERIKQQTCLQMLTLSSQPNALGRAAILEAMQKQYNEMASTPWEPIAGFTMGTLSHGSQIMVDDNSDKIYAEPTGRGSFNGIMKIEEETCDEYL